MSIYDDIPVPMEPPAAEPKQQQPEEQAPKVENVVSSFDDFLREVERNKHSESIDIGFPILRQVIRSALTKGLICIGAAPSAGKTAFIMQMAFNIAKSKKPRNVLIFSLEMPKNEIIARDVSRMTYLLKRLDNSSKADPRTTAEILSGCTFDPKSGERVNFTDKEQGYIKRAQDMYIKYAEYIYIHEPETEITADQVAAIAERFTKEHNGEPPVIFIDYLQLLAPPDMRMDERRANTHNTIVFKTLSKYLGGKGTTVFAISSTARSNYYETDPEGFGKESGGIEYTADSTLFIQYAPAFENYTAKGRTEADRIKNKENACKAEASKDERDIIISVIKNRAGQRNQYITYTYYAKYNYYYETGRFSRSFKENAKEAKNNGYKRIKSADEEDNENIEL